MKYTFPYITHIDQVLPHLSDDFVVADRGPFKVINYNVVTSDTFRPVSLAEDENDYMTRIIRRECRGLTFWTDTGVIARRPYHKFFNIGENVEFLPENIPLIESHHILYKEDGSMIATTYDHSDDKVYWGTKMLAPDFHNMVELFTQDKKQYYELARTMWYGNHTPIFEFCSRQNRVVLDYPEDRLVLTAIRNMHTGEYYSYDDLVDIARRYEIPVVQAFGSTDNIDTFIQNTRDEVDREGYVIRWSDGAMAKAKSDWYVAIHKTKDDLLWERNVISIILDEKVDDVIPFLIDTDRERLIKFRDDFLYEWMDTRYDLAVNLYDTIRSSDGRKDWAINHSKRFGTFSSVGFSMFDEIISAETFDSISELVYNNADKVLENNLISNSKLEQFKHMNGFTWKW